MKIYIANDHAGYDVKMHLLPTLKKHGEVTDLGADSADPSDYPVYAQKLAKRMQVLQEAFCCVVQGLACALLLIVFHTYEQQCVTLKKTPILQGDMMISMYCV